MFASLPHSLQTLCGRSNSRALKEERKSQQTGIIDIRQSQSQRVAPDSRPLAAKRKTDTPKCATGPGGTPFPIT
jgi:hypothetical protein